jgi:hypothetical protein
MATYVSSNKINLVASILAHITDIFTFEWIWSRHMETGFRVIDYFL